MTDKRIEWMIQSFTLNEFRRGLKAETVKRKIRIIEMLKGYLEETPEAVTLFTLTEENLKDYLNTFIDRVSVKEYNSRLSNIRGFYQYLKDEDMILINPVLNIKSMKITDEKHLGLFTEDEVKMMLDVIPETYVGIRDRAILELLYSSALRINELVSLDTCDVDLRYFDVTVRYGKNEKERIVPVGETAVKALHSYLDIRIKFIKSECDEAMFLNLEGRRISSEFVRKRIRLYKKISGVGSYGTCHAFRHSCATHMLKNGASLPMIRRILGHSKLTSTEKYAHVMNEDLKRIHAMSHPKAELVE